MKKAIDIVVLADLLGTALFACEGAESAMHGGLDLFGVLAISFVASLGGGVVRDLLIGATPPAAISDWRYPCVSFLAGTLTFVLHSQIRGIESETFLFFDACALALFAVSGTEKARLYRIGLLGSTLMGVMTAVGGGVVRDVLLARIPEVLRENIYASAALFGAVLLLVLRRLGLRNDYAAIGGGVGCLAIRLLAIHYGWQLPKVLL